MIKRTAATVLTVFMIIISASCMGGESALPGGIGLDFTIDTDSCSRFATISPELAISQYRVSFISFNGEAVSEEDQIFAGTSGALLLDHGTWVIQASAELADETAVAESAEISVDVVAGTTSEQTITLELLNTTGELSISLETSGLSVLSVTGVNWSLYKGLTSPTTLVDGAAITAPYAMTYTGDSGTDYRLSASITAEDSGSVSYTAVFEGIVHVFGNLTTTGTIAVSDSDFID